MKYILIFIQFSLISAAFGQKAMPYFGAGIDFGKDKFIADIVHGSPAWEAGMEKCLYGNWYITAISNPSTGVNLPKVKKKTDIGLVKKGLIGQQGTTIKVSVKESKSGEKQTFNILLDYVNCRNMGTFNEFKLIINLYPDMDAPLTKDQDGDGITDCDDVCPTIKGEILLKGCPALDTDNDGVPDHLDKCPQDFGTKEYQGCLPPIVKPTVNKPNIDLCSLLEQIILDYPNGFDNVRDTIDIEGEDGYINELKIKIPEFVISEIIRPYDEGETNILRIFNGYIVYGKNAETAKLKFNEFLTKFSNCKSKSWTYDFNTEDLTDGFRRTDITIYKMIGLDEKLFKNIGITLWVRTNI